MAPFSVIKPLGAGGFGRVDLVKDGKGEYFAQKTFSPSQNLNGPLVANVRKRFIREAKTQSGIKHRNIVKVWPLGLVDDPPWYLMPVADATLQDDLAKDKLLGGQYLIAITDIVAALNELHQAGIYHRDLKPQNVLRFTEPGSPGFRYAVSDFGLVAMSETHLSSLTTTGMAKGADYFTAPEITSDLRKASPKSDIYSLGCILHEMVGTASRVPCNEIRDPGDFGPILRSCTRTDPGRRFTSVQSFLDALLSITSGKDTPTTPEAADFSGRLEAGEPLDEQSWCALIEYVEDNAKSQNCAAILGRLRLEQIQDLCNRYVNLADRLGTVYAEWITNSSFAFERCDGLANNLEIFTNLSSSETCVECLMALLRLGTSHNRWYVEHIFMRLCGPSMNSDIARRLAIEFRATGEYVCRLISHLELSIGTPRANLHPNLIQVLGEICP